MPLSRGKLFGTDGVRGIANADLTPELALSIGRAFGAWLRADREGAPVLLGRDTRISGSMLAAATAAGLCAAGVEVLDCGILPTPALILLTRRENRAGGVILSASHNPPAFNGIKLVDGQGAKLADEVERTLEDQVFAEDDLCPTPGDLTVGAICLDSTAGARYLDALFALLEGVSLGGLKVVLDCGYGAAWELAPAAFTRAGAVVTSINASPDGARINLNCGSQHPEQLAQEVVARGADLGVAFDGDADRAILVDAAGTVRNGDHMKYLLAADLQASGRLDPPVVVGTLMTNLGLELALHEIGIKLLRVDVGDRFVAEEMRRSGAVLGGEQSGHIIFAQTEAGDGIYTALQVCEVLARTGRPLAELAAPVQPVPQTLINIPVRDKHSWEQDDDLRAQVADWEQKLAGAGRVNIRPSGTEPLVRVMVEALDEQLMTQAAEQLADHIAQHYGFGELLSEEE